MMHEMSHKQVELGDAMSTNDESRGTAIPLCDDHGSIDDEDDTLKRSGPHNLNRTGYDEGSKYNSFPRLHYFDGLYSSRVSQCARKVLCTYPKKLSVQRRDPTGMYSNLRGYVRKDISDMP